MDNWQHDEHKQTKTQYNVCWTTPYATDTIGNVISHGFLTIQNFLQVDLS